MTAKAKLTETQIAEIRALAAGDPPIAKTEIARRFGVHQSQISRLLAGKAHGVAQPDSPLAMVPWGNITPNITNVRSVEAEHADPDLDDLAASILARGILQPLRVTAPERDGGDYVLVDGHRRWRAMQSLVIAGDIEASYPVPVLIAPAQDERADLTLDQLAANLARREMEVLDVAEAFRTLTHNGRSTAEIAKAVGRTQRYVQMRLALARKLSEAAKETLAAGRISTAQAEALCDADDGQQMHILSHIHRFPTEASIRDYLRPKPQPAPLPTVAEMMAGAASSPSSPPGNARGGPPHSFTDAELEALDARPAAEQGERRSLGPANDTAGAAFPPFRHFRVLAAERDHDNMPKTLVLQNIITGTTAAYTRFTVTTPEAEE